MVEHGMITAGEMEFNASMALQPTAIVARNLAVLAQSAQMRLAYYSQAWTLWKKMPADDNEQDTANPTARLGLALAKEYQALLTSTADWVTLQAFHADLAKHCPACM